MVDRPYADHLRRAVWRDRRSASTGGEVFLPAERIQAALWAGIVVLPTAGTYSQPLECGAEDYTCLARSYELACREPSTAATTCEAWLERLEAHAFADQPAWQLAAAAAYYSLSEWSEATNATQELRERSTMLLENVLLEQESGRFASEAYLGLAAWTDDLDENIALLRQALLADPSNAPAAETLARLLATRGSEPALLEAAEAMESAYLAQRDPKRWHLASSAVALYESAGETSRAQRLKERVFAESGMNQLLDRLEELDDAARAKGLLGQACNVDLVALFGADRCLRGIESVASAVGLEQDLESQQRLAEAATIGMTSVINAPGFDSDEEARFRAVYETFISLGVRSAEVYEAYSHLLDDPILARLALEEASDLAPQNGQLLFRLGLAYLNEGMWQKAIASLEKAEPLLPEWVPQEVITMQLERARAGLESSR